MNPIFSPPLPLRDCFSKSPVTLKDGSEVEKHELVSMMESLAKIKNNPSAKYIWHAALVGKPITDLWTADLAFPDLAVRLHILSETHKTSSSTTHTLTKVATKVIRNAVVFDGANFVVIDPRSSSPLLESSKKTTLSSTSAPSNPLSNTAQNSSTGSDGWEDW